MGPAVLEFIEENCQGQYYSSHSYSYKNRDLYITVKSNNAYGNILLDGKQWKGNMKKIEIDHQGANIEVKYSGNSHRCRFKLKIETTMETTKPSDYCN